jgi:hypothetical protein
MGAETMAKDRNEPETLCHWSARKLNPLILLYVATVFIVMIVLSYFVFHSLTGVKALVVAAVGAVVPLFIEVVKRIEYRLTEQGLECRPLDSNESRAFKGIFQLDELSHVVPVRHGFKFYRPLNETNPFRRFWKAHISDQYSGEVHVDKEDQERVLKVLAQHGISSRRSIDHRQEPIS